MRPLLILFSLLFFSVGLYAQESTNILFIGNSITYFNDMPQTVKAIAEEKGHPTNVTMYAPGGNGFIHHVENPTVYNHIKQGNWDFVVLQPGSSESAATSQTKEQTLIRAKILNDSIAKYNPCAKVYYYQISNGVWGNSPDNLVTYNTVMDTIKSNVEYWADGTNSAFAPAGEAMRKAWNDDTSTLLWGNTGDIHPNPTGSYLIACTIFSSIFQEPSLGADVSIAGMTEAEKNYYQNIADTTVLNHLDDWRINTYHLNANFSTETIGNAIQFISTSTNAIEYSWDFGDVTYSTEENPEHIYADSGDYLVTLTVNNGYCQEKMIKTISYSKPPVENDDVKAFMIYPNPFMATLYIQGEAINVEDVKIYNAVGQIVDAPIETINDKNYEISTSHFETGIYFIKLNNKVYKLIKK